MKFFPKCIHRSCYPRTKRRLLLNTFGGGILNFQRGKLFTCSVVLRGGRGPAGRYRCVWGALAVFRPHWVCPGSPVCALPAYTAQALGCSIWSVPCLACGFSFRVLHKSADSVAPAFCAFPGWSSSGSQELDGRTLPGCRAPSPLRGPSLSFPARAPCVYSLVSILGSWALAATLTVVSTIQNLRKSLVRNWRPSAVW